MRLKALESIYQEMQTKKGRNIFQVFSQSTLGETIFNSHFFFSKSLQSKTPGVSGVNDIKNEFGR